jgi:hypothetical protein
MRMILQLGLDLVLLTQKNSPVATFMLRFGLRADAVWVALQ